MSYVGNTPTTQSFIEGTDYFNGDGSTVAFTLSRTVVSPNDIIAVVNNVVQQPNSAYTISGTTITFTSAPSAGSSNVYVRYMSTTTQSITPSQNTVSYSTLNSDTQSKLGISYKNRVINGAMLIDQRNAGAYSAYASASFVVDRFVYYSSQSGKLVLGQNLALAPITAPAGFTNYLGVQSQSAYSILSSDYFWVEHRIEGFNTADLNFGSNNAKTVTLSFWVYSSLTGSFGGALGNTDGTRNYPFNYTISAANTWTQISVTVPGDTSGTWVGATNGCGLRIAFGLGVGSNYTAAANAWTSGGNKWAPTSNVSVVGTSGATWYITGVQLEVGTQATTFDYRSYGTELALCQRYCIVISQAVSNQRIFGFNYTNSFALCRANFPVTTRVAPTGANVTNPTTMTIYQNGNGSSTITGVTFDTGDIYGADLIVSAGVTANAGSILALNSSGNKIEFTGMEL